MMSLRRVFPGCDSEAKVILLRLQRQFIGYFKQRLTITDISREHDIGQSGESTSAPQSPYRYARYNLAHYPSALDVQTMSGDIAGGNPPLSDDETRRDGNILDDINLLKWADPVPWHLEY